MLKTRKVSIINSYDFDKLVIDTYNRPYCYQQQDGCKSRGSEYISIPHEETEDYYKRDIIPEVVNGSKMGVSFKAWLERDPKQLLENNDSSFSLDLFWSRNFYPSFNMIINDLYKKGLVEKGEYMMVIDW